MFLTRRPTESEIKNFLDRSQGLPLSYEPVGLARQQAKGFRLDVASCLLGQGMGAFESARRALTQWKQFELGWVELFPCAAPTRPGTVVAVLIRHLGLWSLNACRIVYSLDAESPATEFGFAYGTLMNHAEMGEEIFVVS